MSRVVLVFRPASGQPEIVEQLVANEDAIASVINGDLEADTNIKVSAPSAALTGAANVEGTASTLLRSDVQFIINGIESLSAEPTSGHRKGRMYFNTTTNQAWICTDASAPTYIPFTNQAPSEIPLHGSSHDQNATDPIGDLGIGSDQLGRSISTTVPGANVSDISDSAFTNVVDSSAVVLAGSQVVSISGRLLFNNTIGADARVAWRVIDTSNSDAFVIGNVGLYAPQATTSGVLVQGSAQLAAGSHVFRLQASFQHTAGTSTGMNIFKTLTVNGQAFTTYLNVLVG